MYPFINLICCFLIFWVLLFITSCLRFSLHSYVCFHYILPLKKFHYSAFFYYLLCFSYFFKYLSLKIEEDKLQKMRGTNMLIVINIVKHNAKNMIIVSKSQFDNLFSQHHVIQYQANIQQLIKQLFIKTANYVPQITFSNLNLSYT